MKNLRNRFERFCYKNRNLGIPNLMLFVTLGAAIVFFIAPMDPEYTLYRALCFDRDLILQGQVWRLITYVFTYRANTVFMTVVSLVCYFSLGRGIENAWGTFKFNLFYFTGILLMDIYAMIFNVEANVFSLNLSLFLSYATLYPDARFLLFFIIPVKAWILAVFNLALVLLEVYLDYSLFPLISLANYFLFFGKDVANVLPMSWRVNFSRLFRKKKSYTPKTGAGPIPFPSAGSYQASVVKPKAPYTHKCTVCGRTDISDPQLEFRYCSRCQGYHCYCEEHIGNHTHIQEGE